MTFTEITNAIEKEAPIEDVKQWHKADTIYIRVKCPDTKKFISLSERFNGLVPLGSEETETILITRRA